MKELLLSFGCGICFSFGAMFGLILLNLLTQKGRDEIKAETLKHYKAVEERLAIQVTTLIRIADHIDKL